jgi:hypothetical protein
MSDEIRHYTLAASAAHTTAETKTFTAKPLLKPHKRMMAVLKVTDAATAAGDTLDVYVDLSLDDGATWINGVHFTQVLGNGANALTFLAVFDTTTPGTSVIAATADCAAGAVRPQLAGNQARARHVLVDSGGGAQSFTYSLVLYGLD